MRDTEAEEIARARIDRRACGWTGDRAAPRAALARVALAAHGDDELAAEVRRWQIKLDARAPC